MIFDLLAAPLVAANWFQVSSGGVDGARLKKCHAELYLQSFKSTPPLFLLVRR